MEQVLFPPKILQELFSLASHFQRIVTTIYQIMYRNLTEYTSNYAKQKHENLFVSFYNQEKELRLKLALILV